MLNRLPVGTRPGPLTPGASPRARRSGAAPQSASPASPQRRGPPSAGSPSLPAFLAANKADLTADLAMLCDTNMWNAKTPMITTMLRGLALEEVVIRAASRDLHSGLFGGAAVNPIHVLSKIIADLRDDKGAVTLPGFYDGVSELPEEVAAQWRALDFNEAKFLGDMGLSQPAGERGRSILELMWARPTFDVNGIIGGYTGAGSKTVLPAEASAKFSFRLVGQQDPEKVLASFRAFVNAHLPPDCEAQFIRHGASPGLTLPFASEPLSRARRALQQEWGVEPVLGGSGGSIPIVGDLKRDLGMDALMVGFGLDDDRIHSPNEKYELSSFHKGTRSWARILAALAG
jgi:acetylornithine deacetylase/succinyl-diaminopimelate desuccinylase-like protein